MQNVARHVRCLPSKSLQAARSCSTKKDAPSTQMPKELTRETDITSKVELSKLVTKKDLEWRTPWHQREGQNYSMLRTFYSEDNHINVIKLLQTPINLSPSAIKKWWAKKKEEEAIALQQYLPERNQILGNELAAAHFIVFKGGAVKFFNDNKWIKQHAITKDYNLPKFYEADKILQGIDCTDMNLYYEGLANLKDLKQVEWFSINGCDNLDDWAMDRISHIFSESLLYLDIRNCSEISHRGLGALCKMKKLKILYVDDITVSSEFEMVCLMLQDLNPSLDIRE